MISILRENKDIEITSYHSNDLLSVEVKNRLRERLGFQTVVTFHVTEGVSEKDICHEIEKAIKLIQS